MSLRNKLLPLAGWLTAFVANAEAGKGLSKIAQGEILGLLFFFGFGIPAGLGFAVYRLVKAATRPGDNYPSLTLMVFLTVLVWWGIWALVLK